MCCCSEAQPTGEEVKNPVCGMIVDPAQAAGSSKFTGQTYSFCSEVCKTRFDASPTKYAAAPDPAVERGEPASTSVDPVCGMKVDPAKAAAVMQEGMRYFFCSQGCATKFKANPGSYLKPEADETPSSTAKDNQPDYVCPMHPEVQKSGPGSCAKCGMALEPAVVEAAATKTQYTCPMHPQIIRMNPATVPSAA